MQYVLWIVAAWLLSGVATFLFVEKHCRVGGRLALLVGCLLMGPVCLAVAAVLCVYDIRRRTR